MYVEVKVIPYSYKSAGIDRIETEDLKDKIASFASITHDNNVVKSGSSFAGIYRLSGYTKPMLISSTDGVGSKLNIATLLDHYESIGVDLVNLNVNDIITCGAKPLFLLDYISIGKLDHQVIEPLMRGMAWACRAVECSIIGGETAQAPDLYRGNNFDIAGTIVGVVEEDAIIDFNEVNKGDVLLGIPSSGVHTNGFTLIRSVFDIDNKPSALFDHYMELGHTLGEELLVPHRNYYLLLEPHFNNLKAIAHITGGGLIGNLPRVLPPGLAAVINTDSWDSQPIFSMIQAKGVDIVEMYHVFNMGLGMVLICEPSKADELQGAMQSARIIGEVVSQIDDRRVMFNPAID
ncbi:phosphoribosylformylglycinamidine cyclo-ligase [SAR202 cluster bacterium AC-409-J13_OGT_754m]|nr:phosphoribosylformylglycinamidine cyclo-ligase [SAR202 cluster bacterium AC-409-J13_OGT_754m]